MENTTAVRKMNHTRSLEVIFDNGGGITVQCARFVHAYNDPRQAAEDVAGLLAGADTADWEGHEPEHRISYNYEQLRNGGYVVMSAADLKKEKLETEPIRVNGFAQRDFLVALTGREIAE